MFSYIYCDICAAPIPVCIATVDHETGEILLKHRVYSERLDSYQSHRLRVVEGKECPHIWEWFDEDEQKCALCGKKRKCTCTWVEIEE